MAQTRQMSPGPMVGALLVGAALTSVVVWHLNVQSLDRAVKAKRSAVKKLVLSGNIPPNQEVVDYLTGRQQALEARYRYWLDLIASPPMAEAAQADPQLYFQQQVHEVQRTLERLATAREMPVPAQLGLPKELPPSDTVPRLLTQLQLVQQAAELILEQGVGTLSSLKIEDPQPVSAEEESPTFLIQLPVRIRLTGSLPQVITVLSALQRPRPLIDVRSLRLATTADPLQLDAEFVIARYLVMTATPSASPEEAAATKPKAKVKAKTKNTPSRKKGQE